MVLSRILSVYRYIQRHPRLGLVLFIAQAIAGQLFLREIKPVQSQACQEYGYLCVPDLMMGLPFDLNNLYDIWSLELHKAYARGSLIDFAVIMPGFTLTFGALLLTAARRLGMTENLAHLATLAYVSDVGETYISRYGSIIYPTRLPDLAVRFASLSGQCKWIACYAAILAISGAFLLRQPPRPCQRRLID